MLKEIISRLTMVKNSKNGFYDNVGKCPVYFWTDYYFDEYIASSRWGVRFKIN